MFLIHQSSQCLFPFVVVLIGFRKTIDGHICVKRFCIQTQCRYIPGSWEVMKYEQLQMAQSKLESSGKRCEGLWERQPLTDKVKFRLGRETARSQAFSTVCQWDKMLFSPHPHPHPERSNETGEGGLYEGRERERSLPSCISVTNEKSFQKKEKRTVRKNQRPRRGNRGESIRRSWSAVWLKHRTNCTKIKGDKSPSCSTMFKL